MRRREWPRGRSRVSSWGGRALGVGRITAMERTLTARTLTDGSRPWARSYHARTPLLKPPALAGHLLPRLQPPTSTRRTSNVVPAMGTEP